MKRIFTLLLLTIFSTSDAQIKWNCDANQNPSSGVPANLTAGAITQLNNNGTTAITGTTTASTGYIGASGSNNIQSSAKGGALDKNASTYFSVTLTPATGYSVLISSLSFGTRSTTSGATNFVVYSSIDNYTYPLISGTIDNTSPFNWYLKSVPSMSAAGGANVPVTIRIYGYGNSNPSSGTANWKIDDLSVSATAIPGTLLWPASSVTASGSVSHITVSILQRKNNTGGSPIITAGTPSDYSGASGGNYFEAETGVGPFDANQSTYFEVTLTPDNGFGLFLSKVNFGSKSISAAGQGPTQYTIAVPELGLTSSAALIPGNWEYITNDISMGVAANNNLTIRIYGSNATLFPGVNWLLDDIQIIASATQVLPLTLLDLYAQTGKFPVLYWKTENELNVKEFLVERSVGADAFAVIGSVKAQNNYQNKYEFADLNAAAKSLYRLKMVDVDGKFTYSKIISAEVPESDIMFKPVGLAVLRSNTQKKTVIIYDMNGRKVLQTVSSDSDLDIGGLAKGRYYFADIITGERKQRLKFFND